MGLAPLYRRTLAGLLALASTAASSQPEPAADSTVLPLDEPAPALESSGEDDQAGDTETLAESLVELRDNPLDVNTASADELSRVPGIGPVAARAIVTRRRAYGPIARLADLQAASILTAGALVVAGPYLSVGAAAELPEPPALSARDVYRGLRLVITQRLQARLDIPQGYLGTDSARTYRGSPIRVYTRAQARYGRNLMLNLTLEKDPGEAFSDRALGYDHVSAGAGLMRTGRIEALVVGDFVAAFGQGLVLASGAGMGKGSETTRGPVRRGRGLQTYGSADENRYLRGAGATVAVTPWLLASTFASRRRLDASLAAPDSSDLAAGDFPPGTESVVTSLSADGLHRTPSELSRRGALGETLLGGALEGRFDGRRLDARIGAVGYRSRFDMPVAGTERPDARYGFRGDVAGAIGLYGDLRTDRYHAFGEVARDAGGAMSGVAGAGATLGPGSELLVVARRYPREFVTLHGHPFGERNGAGQNETGIYAGALVASGRWTVSAYADLYRFPWLRFNLPRPSSGHEWFLLVEYRPARWLRAYAQARGETRESGVTTGGTATGSLVGSLLADMRRTVRLHADFEASRSLRLRARIEAAHARTGLDPASRGTLVFHDVRYVVRPGFRVDARVTLFQTDDFESRLYQLEGDVAGAFTLPVLQGRGTRAYVGVTLQPMDHLTLQGRVAATFLEDTRRIGSGPDEIEGSRAGDVSVQVKWSV